MSYTNNPRSILAGAGITIAPTTGTGANTITISTSGTEIVTVRTDPLAAVTVLTSDEVVSCTNAGPVTVTLPIGVQGQLFYIKDGSGTASLVNPITINPQVGDTVDLGPSGLIDSVFGSVSLVFDDTGSNWLVI